MFEPMTPKTERARIRTEREYREWQLSLRGLVPVKRHRDQPNILVRLLSLIAR